MCGIFGYANYGDNLSEEQLAGIFDSFSKACVIRGAHACGIAYIYQNALGVRKEGCDLTKVSFFYPYKANVLTAHCRLSIQKNYADNVNNHPFTGKTRDNTVYAMTHNGILTDLSDMRREFDLPETKVSTDSYFIVQLLGTKPNLNLRTLKEVCETLCGSFSFTVLDDKGNFYICRGDVPVYLVHFEKLGLYLYISTRDLFETALKSTFLWNYYKSANLETGIDGIRKVSLGKGDLLKISPDGSVSKESFIFKDELSIHHNWYMHEITETDELLNQLAHLNNYTDEH